MNLTKASAGPQRHAISFRPAFSCRLEPARLLRRSTSAGRSPFASLDAYAPGAPLRVYPAAGQRRPRAPRETRLARHKDDWQVQPGVSLSFGAALRLAELLSRLPTTSRRGCRSPTRRAARKRTSFAPASALNDRSGPVAIARCPAFAARRPHAVRDRNPGYPDPFASAAVAAVAAAEHRKLRRPTADSADVAVQRRRGSPAAEDHDPLGRYTGARGYRTFRFAPTSTRRCRRSTSRAPTSPTAPSGQIESTGRRRPISLQMTLRGRVTRWSTARCSTRGAGRTTTPTHCVVSGQRLRFGRRMGARTSIARIFLLLGRVSPQGGSRPGVGISWNSGAPYTETLGADVYKNGADARGWPACPVTAWRAMATRRSICVSPAT